MGTIIICIIVAAAVAAAVILFCSLKEKVMFAAVVPEIERAADNPSELLQEEPETEAALPASVEEESDEEKSETEKHEEKEEKEKKTCKPFNRAWSIVLSVATVGILCAVSLFLKDNVGNWFGFAKLFLVAAIVIASALIDFKKKIIPNELILVGLAARVVIYLLEIIFCPEDVLAIFKNDLIGFAVGFGVLFVACILSKRAIGFGDVKLFGVIGLCTGAICTYTTLLFGLIVNTIVSLIAIAAKKKNKKDGIPFAPSICVGYLVSLFISSF